MVSEETTRQIEMMLDEVKKLHLWKGSLGEKLEKFKVIHKEINRITGKNIRLRINMDAFETSGEDSGASNWNEGRNTITMVGKLSVITLIHEWGHALGLGEDETSAWSNGIFKKCFPNSWNRLRNVSDSETDTTMVKPQDVAAMEARRRERQDMAERIFGAARQIEPVPEPPPATPNTPSQARVTVNGMPVELPSQEEMSADLHRLADEGLSEAQRTRARRMSRKPRAVVNEEAPAEYSVMGTTLEEAVAPAPVPRTAKPRKPRRKPSERVKI